MWPPVPGSPWFRLYKVEPLPVVNSSTVIVSFTSSIPNQTVRVKQTIALNPGYLASMRRPDRPEIRS